MHCTSSLDKLADDILIQILQALSVREILTLRCTSKRYYSLSKLRCVWYAVFCAEVLARHLPPPGPSCSLSALSSTDLEYRTLLALSLSLGWSRSKANVIVSSGARETVDQIVLVPGGMQVLTVHGNKVVFWLISGKPGSHELQNIEAWSLPGDDACMVVKDMECQGIIAIGSRDNPNRHATVFSLSLKPTLNKLCDYSLIPGTVAGISRHLLFLDTTSQQDGGGIEVLDWHTKTEGTALLPRIPDLFGALLDLVHFSDHILVMWEACISVFPVPHVPAEGRTVVAHTKVFMFYEHISSPIAFTTCVSRGWSGADTPVYAPPQETPSLTIAARGKYGGICLTMLIRLDNDEGAKYPSSFPYRLLRLSPVVPNEIQDSGGCTQICLGSSGRGMFVFGGKVRLCAPSLLFMPPCEMQFGPEFETEKVVYEIESGDVAGGDKVDFDEGMGRLVVAKERGGFDVVQLL
ncbi:hypothetical protein EV702DRAFT_1143371 [Suillus placidus]|uniref:F-box domain-containing protein n=1 Tax=Suillus placidus TaxID=48579 RepID=A0A9P6ZJW8_9AGAM|nr:hypothetical protein EV702DRAFT_1143371 [Suillus placidus]